MVTLEYEPTNQFLSFLQYLMDRGAFNVDSYFRNTAGTVSITLRKEECEKFQQSWVKYQVRNKNPAGVFAKLGT